MIETERLLLLPATIETLRAELANDVARLCTLLGVAAPAEWPPELYDSDAVKFSLDGLEREPSASAWGAHYMSRKCANGGAPVLIGATGFKGAPHEGYVEIGYSVLPRERRRGYAREAVGGMVARAFADARVNYVIAHTLPELEASIGVLRKAGFRRAEPSLEPGAIMFMLERSEAGR